MDNSKPCKPVNMESDGSGGVFSIQTILPLKNILTNSFKFLISSWKFFTIVLAFFIFKRIIFDPNSYTNNDLTLTGQYFEVVLTQLPKNIFYLLFWIGIIPLIILSMKEYMTGQQRLAWKEKMFRYFVPLLKYKFIFFILDFLAVCFVTFSMFNFSRFQFTLIPESVIRIIGFYIGIFEMILGFILFLVPVIIVLENKTFMEGTKKSIDIIRNKLILCLTFILLLNFINPSNISLLLLITSRYAAISGFDYFQLIQNPGFKIIQLILSSGWFIFYYAAIVGFYLNISAIKIRRKKVRIVAVLAILSLLLLTGSVDATTWTVDDSGKANYANIQDAIDSASAGDTILVYSGTYYENVVVNKPLNLLGIDDGGGKPVVNGGKNYSAFTVTLGAGSSTFDGFTVVYAGTGILVYSNYNIIRNNTVLNNGDGIYILNSNDNIIRNNTILNNGNGIHLLNSSYNMLIDNNVNTNNGNVGIFLLYSFDNLIMGNTVSKFLIGISLLDTSSNNTIYNNFFNNNNNAASNSINKWNITETQGINIVGGPYIGGNVWANPHGKGFSQECEDSNSNGICDSPYKLESPLEITNIDHLPLSYKSSTTNLMNIAFIISVIAIVVISYLKRREIELKNITSSIKDTIKGAIFGTISGGIIGFVLFIAIGIKSGWHSDTMLGGLMFLILGTVTGAIAGIIGYACKDAVVGAIFGAVGGVIFGFGMSRIDLIGNVVGGAFFGAIIGSIIAGTFFGKNQNAMTGTIVGGIIGGVNGVASFGDIIGGFTGGALFGAIAGSVIGGIFLDRIIAAISSNRDTISVTIAGVISGSFGGLISGIIFGPSLSSIVIWIVGPIGGAIIGAIFGVLRKNNDAIRRTILGGVISGAIFSMISSEILKIIDIGIITDAFWMGGMDAIYPIILGVIFGAIVGAVSNYSLKQVITEGLEKYH